MIFLVQVTTPPTPFNGYWAVTDKVGEVSTVFTMSLLSTDQMPQHSPGFHHYKSYKYKSRRDLGSENLDPHEEILFV